MEKKVTITVTINDEDENLILSIVKDIKAQGGDALQQLILEHDPASFDIMIGVPFE